LRCSIAVSIRQKRERSGATLKPAKFVSPLKSYGGKTTDYGMNLVDFHFGSSFIAGTASSTSVKWIRVNQF
jgi:hypothetical protein